LMYKIFDQVVGSMSDLLAAL
jgi:hypothetical protein